MKRNGIDFFPYPTFNSYQLQILEAKFRLRGVAIYLKLLQKIYFEEGYYFDISDDAILLLKQEIGVNDNIIPELIKFCIARGLFDKEMYEKYKILTSDEIQQVYLNAVRKRKNFNIKEEYRLPFATNFLKKAEEKQNTAEEKQNTAEELDKGKESKVKERKYTLINESKRKAEEPPCHSDIKKFYNATKKYVADVKVLPEGIDMELLIDKVTHSKFLMQAKNMTLKQCLKYYDKIIQGVYDNDSGKVKTNNNGVIITHDYSNEDLNSFFTDLDKVNFD